MRRPRAPRQREQQLHLRPRHVTIEQMEEFIFHVFPIVRRHPKIHEILPDVEREALQVELVIVAHERIVELDPVIRRITIDFRRAEIAARIDEDGLRVMAQHHVAERRIALQEDELRRLIAEDTPLHLFLLEEDVAAALAVDDDGFVIGKRHEVAHFRQTVIRLAEIRLPVARFVRRHAAERMQGLQAADDFREDALLLLLRQV